MLVKLSHNLSEQTPFYSSLAKPELRQLYDLERGDTCNSFYVTTSNHAGTHVDAPKHFISDGRAISEYGMEELVFGRPWVIDVPVGDEVAIGPEHLEGALARVPEETDILFVRTGFGEFREDERRYVDHGPGFGRAGAELLVSRLPRLRAVAMDFMSVSSFAHEEEGAAAHRVFLGGPRPVLLIEDAKIPPALPSLARVFVVPWFVEGLDSAPCTVFAESFDHA